MKKFITIITSLCLSAVLLVSAAQAQTNGEDIEGRRLAQTGMKFLELSVSPRASALANAVTAQEGNSSSLFYNPAGMASMQGVADVSLGSFNWIGDIGYSYGSVALRPAGGAYGVVGVSIESVNYGDFLGTIRSGETDKGYIDTGTFSPSAYAVGLGYARRLTNRFAVGGQVKYASQNLGVSTVDYQEGSFSQENNKLGTVAFDFGVLYRTGFESLNFAISARNFSKELAYVEHTFELPLLVSIGLSMDVVDLTSLSTETHDLLVTVDAERPRDYYEQIKVGGEYEFMDLLALRAGYVFPNDIRGVSLGAGFNFDVGGIGVNADYSYTSYNTFSNINRLALGLSF